MARVRQLMYTPHVGAGDVEVLTFERLRGLNDRGTQRADFHVLAFARRGRGRVSVDFDDVDVDADVAVWIRPGAVHRWTDIADLDGDLILFTPEAPVTARTRGLAAGVGHHPSWRIASESAPTTRAVIDLLRLQTDAARGDTARETDDLLLTIVLNQLVQPRTGPRTESDSTFTSFHHAVEAQFRRHHDVRFYATLLGYSPRTLTRVAQRHVGVTAKSYIADRIVLEAKRLLAHDELPAARCAAHLGFSDPSNFSQFFRSRVGQLPGRWQRAGEQRTDLGRPREP